MKFFMNLEEMSFKNWAVVGVGEGLSERGLSVMTWSRP